MQAGGITARSFQGAAISKPSERRFTDATVQRQALPRPQTRRITESPFQGEDYTRTSTLQGQTRSRTRRNENDDLDNKRLRRLQESVSRTFRYRSEPRRQEDLVSRKRTRRDGEDISRLPRPRVEQRLQETIQITGQTEVETHIAPTFISNTNYIAGTKEYQTEDTNMKLSWGKGIKVNNINLINGKQTGCMDNNMLFTSANTSPIYSNIRQTRAALPTKTQILTCLAQKEHTHLPSHKI